MNSPLRILLVDDHALFRESLVRLLEAESDLQVIGHCATLTEAKQSLTLSAPDIVLLDYDMGDEVGTDLLTFLREHSYSTRTLFVTAGMERNVVEHALVQGASGILLKHSGPSKLLDAIYSVARGEDFLDQKFHRPVPAQISQNSQHRQTHYSYTDRQREVLRGILDGLANKEIAARLYASEGSVKAVIQELFRKTGVRTRSQLVRIALEEDAKR